MSIQIHDALRRKLEGLVLSTLQEATVSSYGLLYRRAFAAHREQFDNALGGLKTVDREALFDLAGSSPLVDFVYWTLVEELAFSNELHPAKEAPLAAIQGFENLAQRATDIVNLLLSDAQEYVFSAFMPEQAAEFARENLQRPVWSRDCAVVGGWQDWHGDFPRVGRPAARLSSLAKPNALAAVLTGEAALPDEESAFVVQLRGRGYVSKHGLVTVSSDRWKSSLKSFLGLALALKVFVRRYVSQPSKTHYCSIHRKDGDAWVDIGGANLSESDSIFVSGLHGGLAGQRFSELMSDLTRLFGHASLAPRLKLAGKWLFESSASSDPVIAFMQLAVAMEVLLESSGGEAGITQTLASRCAYLIARSADEREKIKREFPNIYSLRSKIVHNGRDRLSYQEELQAERLRELCERVVSAELTLAIADLPREDV